MLPVHAFDLVAKADLTGSEDRKCMKHGRKHRRTQGNKEAIVHVALASRVDPKQK